MMVWHCLGYYRTGYSAGSSNLYNLFCHPGQGWGEYHITYTRTGVLTRIMTNTGITDYNLNAATK